MEVPVSEVGRLQEEGRSHYEARRLDMSASCFAEAIAVAEKVPAMEQAARSLRVDLAVVHIELREPKEALAALEPALAALVASLEGAALGRVHLTWANAQYHSSNYKDASSGFGLAAASFRQELAAGHPEVVTAVRNQALCLSRFGRRPKAISALRGLLALDLDNESASAVKYNLAVNYDEQGLPEAAQGIFESLLPTASPAELPEVLSSLAIVNDEQGRSEAALGFYEQAVEAAETLGDARRQFANVLSNFAVYAAMLGDTKLAGKLTRRLKGWMSGPGTVSDRLLDFEVRSHVATVQKHWRQAAALLAQAEATQKEVFGKASAEVLRTRTRAADLARMSAAGLRTKRRRAERLRKARDLVAASSAEYGGKASARERVTVNFALAMLELELGRPLETLALAPLVLAGAGDYGVSELLWQTLRVVGLARRAIGDPAAAVVLQKIAAERMRLDFLQLSATYRSAPFNEDAAGQFWRGLVETLAAAQRLPEAEAIQACYKRDAILDAARRGPESASGSLPVPLTDFEQRSQAELAQLLASRRGELLELAEAGADSEPGAAEAGWERHVAVVAAWLDRVIDGASLAARAIGRAASLNSELAGRGAVVRYRVLPDRLAISVSGAGEPLQVEVSQPAEAVGRLCLEFRNAILGGAANADAVGQSLFDLLLGPVWHRLSSEPHICIDADGALRYVPVCALVNGGRYLVETTAVSFWAGAPRVARAVPDMSSWRWLGAGTSVLPEVEAELRSLPGGQRRTLLFGDSFTGASLSKGLSDGAEVVHLASHFDLNPVQAGRSQLLMGDGSRLSLDMLRQTSEFDFSRTELLFLSGCNTGTAVQGAEMLESLAGVFHLRGVRNVVGTLWPVVDFEAKELAAAFYSEAGKRSGSYAWAHALRSAQLSMLRSGKSLSERFDAERGGIGVGAPELALPGRWASHVLYAA